MTKDQEPIDPRVLIILQREGECVRLRGAFRDLTYRIQQIVSAMEASES